MKIAILDTGVTTNTAFNSSISSINLVDLPTDPSAQNGHGTLYITLEVPGDEIATRIIADRVYVRGQSATFKDLLHDRLTEFDRRRLDLAIDDPGHLEDPGGRHGGVTEEMVQNLPQVTQASRLPRQPAEIRLHDEEIGVGNAQGEPRALQIPFQQTLCEAADLVLAQAPAALVGALHEHDLARGFHVSEQGVTVVPKNTKVRQD